MERQRHLIEALAQKSPQLIEPLCPPQIGKGLCLRCRPLSLLPWLLLWPK
jgi:hypothetical protein